MERDSFLICKHGDINVHGPDSTYYTVGREAYNDWKEKGHTVNYVSWGPRTSYPLRLGARVQFRWFSELNEEVRAGLKSQNKKLFETFEEAESKKENKFDHINLGAVYILDYDQNPSRLYLVRTEEYYNPTMPDEQGFTAKGIRIGGSHKWGEATVSSNKSDPRRTKPKVYNFTNLSKENKDRFRSLAPDLYEYFEQYYSGSSDFDIDKQFNIVSDKINQEMYNAFKGPIVEKDFIKIKDPYGVEWPLDMETNVYKDFSDYVKQYGMGAARLNFIQGGKIKYSPNINQINNEKSNLRTTHQCLSGRKELAGSAIQSNRGKITTTTGHFGNRQGISSSRTQARTS